jgi:hypothetical protein
MLGTPYLTYALFKVGKIIVFVNYYNFTYTYVVFEIVGNFFYPHGDPRLTLGWPPFPVA